MALSILYDGSFPTGLNIELEIVSAAKKKKKKKDGKERWPFSFHN